MNDNHKSRRFARPGAILLMALLVAVWISGSGILLAYESQSPGVALGQDAPVDTAYQTVLAPTDDTLLAIYVLAYDNSRHAVNTVNLTTKYTETVESIVSGTAVGGVTAVILADLDDYGDTHILTAQNGVVTAVDGLPDANGNLDPSITEYNTADGATLGGFLLWARAGRTGVKTTLSYIGHGTPLPPASQPSIAEIVVDPAAIPATAPERSTTAVTLPFRIGANPEFTDMHDADPANVYAQLLTPYDMSLALDIGTAAGSTPIAVLDLVHCFAASIEELYEVAPYASTTVAAPNYAFFDPSMVGAALEGMANLLAGDPAATPASIANTIKDNYINNIPTDKHPYVLVAVDNGKLPLVKERWDALSAILLNRFAQDPQDTANKMEMAYSYAATNGGVYDTTFCGQEADYVLGAPDALTDITSFSSALGTVFGFQSDVQNAANAVIQAVDQAYLSVLKRPGQPWWVPNPTNWSFSTNASGIAVFNPLLPMTVDGTPYHAWQSLWYTDTLVIAQDVSIGDDVVDVTNPHPYQFITRVGNGATWADVLDVYWRYRGYHPGSDVATALCLPDIREVEEMDVFLVMGEMSDPIQAGTTMAYTLTVTNKTTLLAQNVRLTDTLPADVTFTAVSDSTACQHANGILTCAWPDLPAHETRTVVVDALIDLYKEGPMTNHAAVSVDGENRKYDNQWAEDTEVTTAWTMDMLGGVSITDAAEGDVISYTAVIENTGVGSTTDAILARDWSWRLAVAGPLILEPNDLGVPSFIGNELLRIPYLEPGERLTVTVPLRLVDGPAYEPADLSVSSNEVDTPIVIASAVNIANMAPSVLDDAYTTAIDQVLQVAAPGVLTNDIDVASDDLLAELLAGPTYGLVNLQPDGSFIYTPDAGFSGVDSFSYTSRDKDGASATGVVVIDVLHHVYLPLLTGGS